jgi:hypothetical protein
MLAGRLMEGSSIRLLETWTQPALPDTSNVEGSLQPHRSHLYRIV